MKKKRGQSQENMRGGRETDRQTDRQADREGERERKRERKRENPQLLPWLDNVGEAKVDEFDTHVCIANEHILRLQVAVDDLCTVFKIERNK